MAPAADVLFKNPQTGPLVHGFGRRFNGIVALVALQPSSQQARRTGAELVRRVRRSYYGAVAPRVRSSFVEIVARDDPGPWL